MPVTFTTNLPAPSGTSTDYDGTNITASWTDTINYGDYVVEYSTDGGSTWTTATTVGQNTTSATVASPSGTVWDYLVRITSSTEHASLTGSTVAERYRDEPAITADANVSVTREGVPKDRFPTVTADGTHTALQELREVFPSEEALDVTWDFNVPRVAYVTEWLDEESFIRDGDRGGIGVTLGGSLDSAIIVWVEYDADGDGVPEHRSETEELAQAYRTVTFDQAPFGTDGRYRIAVRGMRQGDTINQADLGIIHSNL